MDRREFLVGVAGLLASGAIVETVGAARTPQEPAPSSDLPNLQSRIRKYSVTVPFDVARLLADGPCGLIAENGKITSSTAVEEWFAPREPHCVVYRRALGRKMDELYVDRLIGPRANVIEFYARYGDVCNTHPVHLDITEGRLLGTVRLDGFIFTSMECSVTGGDGLIVTDHIRGAGWGADFSYLHLNSQYAKPLVVEETVE